MKTYMDMTQTEITEQLSQARDQYAQFAAKGLKLNMARGKPSPQQLDLSMPLLDTVTTKTAADLLQEGTADDLRNYGGLTGLESARELMAEIMDVSAKDVIACGNSSLNIMYDMVSQAMTAGIADQTPWAQLNEAVTFLCPVPGYDRHFALTQHFGIKMVPIPMDDEGPDMDLVEQYVNSDSSVKGIWCVPKYSNPTGVTYSAETVARMAGLKPAAADFRIFWDNAYAVHDLVPDADTLPSIKDACAAAGNDDMWVMFASTSKITFAGAGIAAVAASPANLAEIKARLSLQTIGPDKISHLRHVLFLKKAGGVRPHMQQHAAILAPKFEAVLRGLDVGLAGTGIGSWTRPKGGYFISFDGLPNTAKRVIGLAKEAGMMLTGAGAPFPYGDDPADRNIRIAPSYPSAAELEDATQLLVICVKIASLEALLD